MAGSERSEPQIRHIEPGRRPRTAVELDSDKAALKGVAQRLREDEIRSGANPAWFNRLSDADQVRVNALIQRSFVEGMRQGVAHSGGVDNRVSELIEEHHQDQRRSS